MEGRTAGRRRAIDACRTDIPTCGPGERLGVVRERVEAAGQRVCIVVNDDGVVFGRLRGKAWEGDDAAPVEQVMALAPKTIRPDVFLHEIGPQMHEGRFATVILTSYGSHQGGRFLGLLHRDDVDRTLAENAADAASG